MVHLLQREVKVPAAYDRCVKGGGKVRTISKGGLYFHICIPKGGGPSVKGHTKKKKGSLKEARRKHESS